jgi:DNA polymerase
MKHEPVPLHATAQAVLTHKLHRDFETRSKVDLTEVGAARYAADPSTEVIFVAYAVDDDPVQLWRPGDPVPPVWFEAAANPNWTVRAHNDHFESCIERHILHPRFGFPIVPAERHRCTQAMSLALGLPAKLSLLADTLEQTHRKDVPGEKLMHMMSKPRKPLKGEDPNGTYWHDDEDKMQRLAEYVVKDVEAEREADGRLPRLSDAEQAVWVLSNKINDRGFHIDRAFAEAARKIAKAAGPEINDGIKAITAGAVTTINQIDKLKDWLRTQGCATTALDREAIEKLLEDEGLATPVRQALQLRLDGAQAATKKLDALFACAGDDDRIRGAFLYHRASTGRWAGERYQPQNLKRITIKDLDAAIAAVSTGSYEHMKRLYPQPLLIIGECSRPTINAADGNELIGGDLSSIESRTTAWVAGEEWKLDSYRKFDATKDPHLEPYCITACKICRVPDGTFDKNSPERKIGKTCDLAFGYSGGLGAWRNFEPDQFSDAEVEKFKNDWRAAHPKIRQFWSDIDQAAIKAVRDRGEIVRCGPVALKFAGAFLWIRLPSGRMLAFPYPRIIKDDRGALRVLFGDNGAGQFRDCRKRQGAYGGTWTENIVSGIARDILVEAMFQIEAAGYPIVLHIHESWSVRCRSASAARRNSLT